MLISPGENVGCRTRRWGKWALLRVFICVLGLAAFAAHAQHKLSTSQPGEVYVAPASDQAEQALKRFKAAPGLKVDLWAAEPLLANPVAFCFDEKGRVYVCETFRLGAGVDDIRGIMDWLPEELASRTVDERLAEMKRHLGRRFDSYTNESERVRLVEDRAGTGKADHATVFAEHFNTPLDGIGAGVLARNGNVWFANIPNLWLLRDTNNDGFADFRTSLHYGFGVRVGFLGHDLHGLRFGPDGKIYFSIGDRGSNIKVADGRTVGEPEMGCVFRCNPDGSELEVFAYGLRNPQDLVFDQYGNLFTGDNNSDSGDEARWVYLVEGSDNGWRVGYQFMENPYSRGPFNAERIWYPPFDGQPAYIVPPVANIASGPSGVAYFPGTGLPASYQGHFFLVDFRGGAGNSGVHTFTLQPKGAGFELVNREHFLWNILATDVKFGVDGGLYVSDWVEGWGLTGKGRIYRVHDTGTDRDPLVLETKRLLAEGNDKRSNKELAHLLDHADIRVRQEAQFALAARGLAALDTLASVARQDANPIARLHGIWGIGQIASHHSPAQYPAQVATAMDVLVKLLDDADGEVRAQAAKVLGERRYPRAFTGLVKALEDKNPRAQFFAAIALGKLGRADAIPALFALLERNADQDAYLRHAGVMGLASIGKVDALAAAAHHPSSAVRMGVLLAFRRLQRPEISIFLKDPNPALVLEAARAINDEPVNGAMHELAELIDSPAMHGFLSGAPLVPNSVPEEARSKLGLEALLRRVLNANFHFGTPTTAAALAKFAARADAPENMRVEALAELADWEHPSGIDRVVGLWRPVPSVRHKQDAAEALDPQLSVLLPEVPSPVQVALLHCVSRLGITNATALLTQLVANTNAVGKVRAEALLAISKVDLSSLNHALDLARNDNSEELRKAATQLEATLPSADSVGRLATTLQNGSLGEKQNALATLARIPSASANDLLEKWMDQLNAGAVPKELRLDVLEAAGKRSSDSLKEKLVAYQSTSEKNGPLGPFEPCLFGGNAAEGKKVFYEKPEAQCVRCHKINGQGGEVGPDLSHIGSQKDRLYLLESILLPNKQIAQGFDSVTVVLQDGDVQAGVLKTETPDEIVLSSADNGLVRIKKSNIKTRRAALSPMPEGLGKILSKEDLRNLVEFLSSNK
jgi:quinoprotein glucose dehydrogenase